MPDVGIWTYHPHPKSGESLSSWLTRIARGNSYKLHTFCNTIWPGRSIWNRDVDLMDDPGFFGDLARRTGTPFPDARNTSLSALAGVVFDRRRSTAPPRLVLRTGIYHRTRRYSGQQYCSRCLRDGQYFRRNWRLAFMTLCPLHSVRLHDCCQNCGANVVFHRSRHIVLCHRCGWDLSRSATHRPSVDIIQFEARLEAAVSCNVMALGKHELPALQGFTILRQLERLLAGSGRSAQFRSYVERQSSRKSLISDRCPIFEEQGIDQRHHLMGLSAWIFGDWPDRFISACLNVGLWHSWALRDRPDLPEYFVSLVDSELFRPPYKESCEVRSRAGAKRGSH